MSLTDQIRALRGEASEAGDYVMVAICQLALTGDHGLYRAECVGAFADLVTMTQDQAVLECCKSLRDLEVAS